MGRWHCSLAGLLGLLALCGGCATNRPNPFAGKPGTSTTAQAAKKPSLSDRMNGSRDGKPADPSSVAADGADSQVAGSAKNGGHDLETMAYIQQELRDATPEERASTMNNLKGMDPANVRQILRTRRMAMKSGQTQLELAGQNLDPFSQNPIQTVAGDSPAGAPTPRNGSGEGLGTVNAWQNQPAGERGGVSPPVAPNTFNDPGTAQASAGHSSGYRVNQASGSVTAPQPRSAAGKPAAVAVGVPMTAGGALPGTATTALPNNAAVEGGASEQLSRLISLAETEAVELQPGETEAEKQTYIEKQVHLRMLYLMAGKQERALQVIPGLDPADQEFWQQIFWGLTNYFDVTSIPSSSDRATQTVTQLTNAMLRLQEKARLELRNVTFSHKISSFGNYEKYARDEFSPGQEVLLYAEVANIHSEPIPDGKFKTSLKSTIEIYRHGTQGDLIERIDLPETVDVCRTHRRDYFHSYQFTIPAKLSLGPHILKLSVEDQLSHRVGTYTLNFTVK